MRIDGIDVPGAVLDEVAAQPHPLVFVTVSGAHLYGFPSPDSDWDLRGVHLLPLAKVVGLGPRRETIAASAVRDGVELDLVTHDAAKFFGMLLQRNGYVLEQLTSPLVLLTTPAHVELRELARSCVTRRHAHHYLGFAATQAKLVAKDHRVKSLLYLYRVLLTGIHLVRSGEIEANLERLLSLVPPPDPPAVAALIERKREGPERGLLSADELARHQEDAAALVARLEEEQQTSGLPEMPPPGTRVRLDELLVRLRLTG